MRTTRTIANARGFTLIEMLVSTAIFTVVMVIALGALLSMSESDRKAQTIKSVVDNLNFSMDSMTRAMRTGSAYACGAGGDCPNGGTQVSFTDSDGKPVAYQYSQSASACGNAVGCILRSTDGGTTWAAITAPEVAITYLRFYLLGSPVGDGIQPKFTIAVSGYVQFQGGGASSCTGLTSSGASTCFSLQTSVTQRIYDQ